MFARTLIGLFSLAAVFSRPTSRQSLGPFFPYDGTEIEPVQENPDPDLPISQANDQDLTFIKGRTGQANGQIVYLRGRVLSARTGLALPHTLSILLSASASGRYKHTGDEDNTSFPHPETARIIHRTHDEYFQYWGGVRWHITRESIDLTRWRLVGHDDFVIPG